MRARSHVAGTFVCAGQPHLADALNTLRNCLRFQCFVQVFVFNPQAITLKPAYELGRTIDAANKAALLCWAPSND
jgi:hypothetical protein